VGDIRLDRRTRIVADSSVRAIQDIPDTEFSHRADHVMGRFRKTKGSSSQGSNQTEHEHRATQA
jgi:hypothetical protein